MDVPGTRAPTWKRVLAPILDFLMVFFVGGNIIATVAGGQSPSGGFQLEGAPALVLFATIIVYFIVGRKFTRGTLWDRFFGIVRPQPNP